MGGKEDQDPDLSDSDTLVKSGEVLEVPGRPGGQVMLWEKGKNIANKSSGCSTLLTIVSGKTDGFYVAEDAYLNYQGTPMTPLIQFINRIENNQVRYSEHLTPRRRSQRRFSMLGT